MIALSPRLVELLNQPMLNSFVCVKIKDIRLTSFYHDLSLTDGMYISTNLINEVEVPKSTSIVDRDLYGLSLVDSQGALNTLLNEPIAGADFSVKLGFVDYETDAPELESMFIIYEGIVESVKQEVDTNLIGSVKVIVTGSNLLASLDDSSPFYISKESVNRIRSGDASYDQIYEGSGKVILKWGKI